MISVIKNAPPCGEASTYVVVSEVSAKSYGKQIIRKISEIYAFEPLNSQAGTYRISQP